MQGPLFDPLPPGYSGPVKKNEEAPESKPKAEQDDGLGLDDTLPIDLSAESVTSGQPGQSKITTFEQKLSAKRHEDDWARSPNATGTGAIHVKSFHCRLTGDSLEFLDRQINEWLDNHPEYEVKMVTSSMGTWSGKLKEPNLIVNVWV
ncbi:MAG: hypothetical protein P1U30_02305 [Phycisphaerales bacterium]|jgi:hypothetical protein|nr:hypothetical protein [Phycisphaerales bacterium]